MRILVPVLVVTGCTFSPGQKSPDGTPDAGIGVGSGSGSDSGTVARVCHVVDPMLRLCLDFEDALTPTTADLSGGSHDATVSGIVPMQRGTQQAAAVTSSSTISVGETPALDITPALSIEMWLSPAPELPASQPFANKSQYGLALDDQGRVVCQIGGASVSGPRAVALAPTWSHVACTYDGAMLKVYQGGDVVACKPMTNAIPINGHLGSAIGAGYTGGIDDVHVYAKALSDTDVCARAGGSGCVTQCPPPEPG